MFYIMLFSCHDENHTNQYETLTLNINNPIYVWDSSIADTMVRTAIGFLLNNTLDTVHQISYHSVLKDTNGKIFYYMEYINLNLLSKQILIEVYDPSTPQGLTTTITEKGVTYSCRACSTGPNCLFTAKKSNGLIEQLECTGCNGNGCPIDKTSLKTTLNDFNVGQDFVSNMIIPAFIFNSNLLIIN